MHLMASPFRRTYGSRLSDLLPTWLQQNLMEAMPQIFSFWRVVTKLTETDGAQGDTQIR